MTLPPPSSPLTPPPPPPRNHRLFLSARKAVDAQDDLFSAIGSSIRKLFQFFMDGNLWPKWNIVGSFPPHFFSGKYLTEEKCDEFEDDVVYHLLYKPLKKSIYRSSMSPH